MSNTNRNRPVKIHNKVIYWHNGRAVRMIEARVVTCKVKHHAEIFEARMDEIFAATKDEAMEYLGRK